MANATQQLFQQSEVFRQKLPLWQGEGWGTALDLIKKGEVETVNERDYVVPFKTSSGGRMGTFDPNMGDMGRGSSMAGGKMTASFFPLRLNFELSRLAINATKNKSQAVVSAFRDAMKSGMPEFMNYLDMFAHGDGTAVLATATAQTTTSGKTVYTLNTTTSVKRLRRGQYVTVYDNGLTTARSSSTLFIDGVNFASRQITLSGTVPGATSTDKICLEGVSGPSPAGPKGIQYFNATTATGFCLGVDRAVEYEVNPNKVSASGGLAIEHAMLLYHQAIDRRNKMADDMVGLCPTAQQAAIWSSIISVQLLTVTQSQAQMVDRMPALKGKKMFSFGDIPHMLDVHQDADRIDYIVPKTYGRAQLADLDYYEVDGTRFFPLYGASGAPAAGLWFSLCQEVDFYNWDMGSNGVIYGLTLPSGY